jgi:hypothetical protein
MFLWDQTMSASQEAANVVDFAAYRARRNCGSPSGSAGDATQGVFMFAALPIMIPMFAWIPVWGMAPGFNVRFFVLDATLSPNSWFTK